jgi:hypothetical protein
MGFFCSLYDAECFNIPPFPRVTPRLFLRCFHQANAPRPPHTASTPKTTPATPPSESAGACPLRESPATALKPNVREGDGVADEDMEDEVDGEPVGVGVMLEVDTGVGVGVEEVAGEGVWEGVLLGVEAGV